MAKESIKVDEQLTALVMRPRAAQRTPEQVVAQPAGTAPNTAREALTAEPAAKKESK